MDFKLKVAKNGIVLTDENGSKLVFQEAENCDEFDLWAEFLNELTDNYGPADQGRYSEKRVYIIVAPGDRWEGVGECPLRDHPVCPCEE